jgi:hypothetical protein
MAGQTAIVNIFDTHDRVTPDFAPEEYPLAAESDFTQGFAFILPKKCFQPHARGWADTRYDPMNMRLSAFHVGFQFVAQALRRGRHLGTRPDGQSKSLDEFTWRSTHAGGHALQDRKFLIVMERLVRNVDVEVFARSVVVRKTNNGQFVASDFSFGSRAIELSNMISEENFVGIRIFVLAQDPKFELGQALHDQLARTRRIVAGDLEDSDDDLNDDEEAALKAAEALEEAEAALGDVPDDDAAPVGGGKKRGRKPKKPVKDGAIAALEASVEGGSRAAKKFAKTSDGKTAEVLNETRRTVASGRSAKRVQSVASVAQSNPTLQYLKVTSLQQMMHYLVDEQELLREFAVDEYDLPTTYASSTSTGNKTTPPPRLLGRDNAITMASAQSMLCNRTCNILPLDRAITDAALLGCAPEQCDVDRYFELRTSVSGSGTSRSEPATDDEANATTDASGDVMDDDDASDVSHLIGSSSSSSSSAQKAGGNGQKTRSVVSGRFKAAFPHLTWCYDATNFSPKKLHRSFFPWHMLTQQYRGELLLSTIWTCYSSNVRSPRDVVQRLRSALRMCPDTELSRCSEECQTERERKVLVRATKELLQIMGNSGENASGDTTRKPDDAYEQLSMEQERRIRADGYVPPEAERERIRRHEGMVDPTSVYRDLFAQVDRSLQYIFRRYPVLFRQMMEIVRNVATAHAQSLLNPEEDTLPLHLQIILEYLRDKNMRTLATDSLVISLDLSITSNSMLAELLTYETLRVATSHVYIHQLRMAMCSAMIDGDRTNLHLKPNVMMHGPPGVGKSEISNMASKMLVPGTVESVTSESNLAVVDSSRSLNGSIQVFDEGLAVYDKPEKDLSQSELKTKRILQSAMTSHYIRYRYTTFDSDGKRLVVNMELECNIQRTTNTNVLQSVGDAMADRFLHWSIVSIKRDGKSISDFETAVPSFDYDIHKATMHERAHVQHVLLAFSLMMNKMHALPNVNLDILMVRLTQLQNYLRRNNPNIKIRIRELLMTLSEAVVETVRAAIQTEFASELSPFRRVVPRDALITASLAEMEALLNHTPLDQCTLRIDPFVLRHLLKIGPLLVCNDDVAIRLATMLLVNNIDPQRYKMIELIARNFGHFVVEDVFDYYDTTYRSNFSIYDTLEKEMHPTSLKKRANAAAGHRVSSSSSENDAPPSILLGDNSDGMPSARDVSTPHIGHMRNNRVDEFIRRLPFDDGDNNNDNGSVASRVNQEANRIQASNTWSNVRRKLPLSKPWKSWTANRSTQNNSSSVGADDEEDAVGTEEDDVDPALLVKFGYNKGYASSNFYDSTQKTKRGKFSGGRGRGAKKNVSVPGRTTANDTEAISSALRASSSSSSAPTTTGVTQTAELASMVNANDSSGRSYPILIQGTAFQALHDRQRTGRLPRFAVLDSQNTRSTSVSFLQLDCTIAQLKERAADLAQKQGDASDPATFIKFIEQLQERTVHVRHVPNVEPGFEDDAGFMLHKLATKLDPDYPNVRIQSERALFDGGDGHSYLALDILFGEPNRAVRELVRSFEDEHTRERTVFVATPNERMPYLPSWVQMRRRPGHHIDLQNPMRVDATVYQSIYTGASDDAMTERLVDPSTNEERVVIREDIELWATKRHFKVAGYQESLADFYSPTAMDQYLRAIYAGMDPRQSMVVSSANTPTLEQQQHLKKFISWFIACNDVDPTKPSPKRDELVRRCNHLVAYYRWSRVNRVTLKRFPEDYDTAIPKHIFAGGGGNTAPTLTAIQDAKEEAAKAAAAAAAPPKSSGKGKEKATSTVDTDAVMIPKAHQVDVSWDDELLRDH